MTGLKIGRRVVVTSLMLLTAWSGIQHPRPAAAAEIVDASGCALWASPTGNDGAAGTTRQTALQSIRVMVSRLQAGQTGCLSGAFTEYAQINASNGVAGNPITIRSAPGETATYTGQLHLQGLSHDIVVSDIKFLGLPNHKSSHLMIDGDRIEFRRNDISHPQGICVDIGHIEAYSQVYSGTTAEDFVLAGNSIHNCGTNPNITWYEGDSGVHGIYIIDSKNARIVDNLIFDNQWRGLQTWPKAEGTLIANNVFDGNATNVNIGSALNDGYPWKSINTTVRDNIITNATLWRPTENSAQVHGYFPAGATYGNVVTGNCLFGTDPSKNFSGNGYVQSGNLVADPRYRNVATNDFMLADNSPCLGKGPASIQPQAQQDVTAPNSTIATGPAAFVKNATAGFSFTATEAGSTFQCKVDAAAFAACVTPFTTPALADGAHTLQVRAIDAAGNIDASPAAWTWTIDRSLPTATAPIQTLVGPLVKDAAGSVLIPVKLTWTGADTGSGVASFELQQTADGATWTTVAVPAGATTVTRNLVKGSTAGFRVRPIDRAGNAGAWATGPRVLAFAYQNDHPVVTFTGSWATHTSTAFYGGNARYASTAGTRATLRVSNVRNVALVSYIHSSRGQARVYADGVLITTVDLYSATANVPMAVVAPLRWTTPGDHLVTIEVVGTAGHARVDVDAFVVLHDQP